jgi:hypothetical protein
MTKTMGFMHISLVVRNLILDIGPVIIKIHSENVANVRIQRRWRGIEIKYERKTPQKH